MRNVVITTLLLFFSLINILVFTPQPVYAGSTTIGLFPQTGSYNKPFDVQMVIDGHGDNFNAAQAKVTLSSNLSIQNLTLGDCNFSFLKTPSIQNPTFEGLAFHTSLTKCTVYTLTLLPTAKGEGKVTLSSAAVKRYGDAVEILSKTYDGKYTLTDIPQVKAASTQNNTKNTSKDGLYTVYLKVQYGSDKPVTNVTVTLKSVAKKDQQQTTTDTTGIAHFSNVPAGVYDAIVKDKETQLGENIINVNGSNHVLTLGISLSTQKNNQTAKQLQTVIISVVNNPLLLIGMLVVGIIAGVGITLLVIKLVSKRNKKK